MILPPEDSWRSLFERRCVRCDYDLEGHLSGTVVCPECGQVLDEQLLVLRGTHAGRRRGDLRTVYDFAKMAATLAVVLLIVNYTSSFTIMIVLFAGAMLFSFALEPAVRRGWNLEPSESAKLLIRRDGFRQIDGDAVGVPSSRRRWIGWLSGLVAICVMSAAIGGFRQIGTWGGVVAGMGISTLAERRRAKLARASIGAQPGDHGFIPWDEVTAYEVSPSTWFRKTHVVRIRLVRVTSWTRNPLADFDWPTTPDRALQLVTLIRRSAQICKA